MDKDNKSGTDFKNSDVLSNMFPNSNSDVKCTLNSLSALHSEGRINDNKLENTEPRPQLEPEDGLGKRIAKPKVGHKRDNFEIGQNCKERGEKGEGGAPDKEKVAPESLMSGEKFEKRVKDNYKQRHLSEFLQSERVKTTNL